jgi:uncharacterized protein (DUF111 family)
MPANLFDTLVVDCQVSGISGDMLLSSLVGLGMKEKEIQDIAKSCSEKLSGVDSVSVSFVSEMNSGFKVIHMLLHLKESVDHRDGAELMKVAAQVAEEKEFTSPAKKFANSCLRSLVETEAHLHGVEASHVHLHETGSVDTLIDILGVAKAVEDLGLLKLKHRLSTPVAAGGGQISFSHGMVPSPSPATLLILAKAGFTILGGPVKEELTTPTGAAILSNLVSRTVDVYPLMRVISIGLGGGSKKIVGLPTILRLVCGKIRT